MIFIDSNHWERKRKYRPDITNDIIEYAIMNSNAHLKINIGEMLSMQFAESLLLEGF